ncbi:hypothetical protein [Endozoicomonas sp. 4G]|uniref:hypothetical protein n=1 Tax=Endozoicomonas sp. 4G TaxID=2872754 RepID=UPI0020786A30|nr:hypothetical protein [Endozoicomonas sp. 4G]
MIKQKLTALALTLPLTALSLAGFANEEEPKPDETDKSEWVINLQSLVAQIEDSTEEDDDEPFTDETYFHLT